MRTEDTERAYVYMLVNNCISLCLQNKIEESLDCLYSAVDSLLCYGEFDTVARIMSDLANRYNGYIASFEYNTPEDDKLFYNAILNLSLGVLTLIVPVPKDKYVFVIKDCFFNMCVELCRVLGYNDNDLDDIMRGLNT